MIVLVVDDQINVVNGIVSGVDWASAGVSKVLHAYNATMARDVLENQPVDILLSDIEMPVEDGLSLLRWIRKKELPVECIFLTAHADFIYAAEALKLGSFDYLLQPARYEEICGAVSQSCEKSTAESTRATDIFIRESSIPKSRSLSAGHSKRLAHRRFPSTQRNPKVLRRSENPRERGVARPHCHGSFTALAR